MVRAPPGAPRKQSPPNKRVSSCARIKVSPSATIILTGAPARQLLAALPYLPTSLSVARTRGPFVVVDVQGCTSVAVSGRKERQRSPKPSCRAVDVQGCAGAAFAPTHNYVSGNLRFRWPQWVRRRHIHDADDGRRGPYSARYGAALRLHSSSARPRGEKFRADESGSETN